MTLTLFVLLFMIMKHEITHHISTLDMEKILVVDDSISVMCALSSSLKTNGYTVCEAFNGRQAVDMSMEFAPDLILIDVLMPEVGGFEACKAIKTNPTTSSIPIVVMSSITNIDDKVRAFELGAVDFVCKPLHLEEVLARINTHLTINRLQKQLLNTNKQLEEMVRERTTELTESNMQLKSFIKDITLKSNELRASELLLTTVFNVSPLVMILLDWSGKIVKFNKKAEMAFFCDEDKPSTLVMESVLSCVKSLEGRSPGCGNNSFCKECFIRSYVEDSLTNGVSVSGKEFARTVLTGEGTYNTKYFVLSSTSVKTKYSSNVLITLEDITERKRQEKELMSAKNTAEMSDKLKTAFLANISHEIRTPMNAIMGFTNLMVNLDEGDERRRDFGHIVIENGQQLMTIINDIIDMSRIEAGELTFNCEHIDVFALLYEVYANYVGSAEKKHLKLNLELPSVVSSCSLFSDGNRLRQVLSNIVNNAIKFTREGCVEIGCAVNDGIVQFYVSDSGIGIDLAKQARVFDPFWQVEFDYSRQYGGTGLGLSIAKKTY